MEGLEYEAFEPMALGVLGEIADEIAARFGVERLAIVAEYTPPAQPDERLVPQTTTPAAPPPEPAPPAAVPGGASPRWTTQ